MHNNIKFLDIENFKSIRKMRLECKRVNVFIGEPNVGKSNILEALSLFAAGYSAQKENHLQKDFLGGLVRYEQFRELFYDKDWYKNISVKTDKASVFIHYHPNNSHAFSFIVGEISDELIEKVNSNEGDLSKYKNEFLANAEHNDNSFLSPLYEFIRTENTGNNFIFDTSMSSVRPYNFVNANHMANRYPHYLLPPHGNNLFSIIDGNKTLRQEMSRTFQRYGLDLVADRENAKFEIQKRDEDNYVTKLPFSGVADTFRRLAFYSAAIESNHDAVIVFEEPEVHSFPPYISKLANSIAADSDNQYFLTTHSPYMLETLIESVPLEDLNVSLVYFDNHETKINVLNDDAIQKLIDKEIDIFFNLQAFQPQYD